MAAASTLTGAGNIIDVEFETVVPAVVPEYRPKAVASTKPAAGPVESLSILRGADPQSVTGQQPDQLTPSFLFFTALAALVVFWVCGGRFLLY